MKYMFKFKLFGSKVQMFSEDQRGIVIEKEPHVVCVYATDENHQNIFCAIPLCAPKFLKGAEYIIDFCENGRVKIIVENICIFVDFNGKKCAINKPSKCYGSDIWGHDVQIPWSSVE